MMRWVFSPRSAPRKELSAHHAIGLTRTSPGTDENRNIQCQGYQWPALSSAPLASRGQARRRLPARIESTAGEIPRGRNRRAGHGAIWHGQKVGMESLSWRAAFSRLKLDLA